MAGNDARCSGRTSTTVIMYGMCVPGAMLNQRCACSSEQAGAKGRNASRILTIALMRSRMTGFADLLAGEHAAAEPEQQAQLLAGRPLVHLVFGHAEGVQPSGQPAL